MDSIIVNPKNEKELKFISELLKKLGVSCEVISIDKEEDLNDQESDVPEEYYQVLEERRAEYLKGNAKTSTWEVVKARLNKELK